MYISGLPGICVGVGGIVVVGIGVYVGMGVRVGLGVDVGRGVCVGIAVCVASDDIAVIVGVSTVSTGAELRTGVCVVATSGVAVYITAFTTLSTDSSTCMGVDGIGMMPCDEAYAATITITAAAPIHSQTLIFGLRKT